MKSPLLWPFERRRERRCFPTPRKRTLRARSSPLPRSRRDQPVSLFPASLCRALPYTVLFLTVRGEWRGRAASLVPSCVMCKIIVKRVKTETAAVVMVTPGAEGCQGSAIEPRLSRLKSWPLSWLLFFHGTSFPVFILHTPIRYLASSIRSSRELMMISVSVNYSKMSSKQIERTKSRQISRHRCEQKLSLELCRCREGKKCAHPTHCGDARCAKHFAATLHCL